MQCLIIRYKKCMTLYESQIPNCNNPIVAKVDVNVFGTILVYIVCYVESIFLSLQYENEY